MRYRSIVMCAAALSCAPISIADAQSVYVAPGGVYVASGNVYVTPAPAPYGAPVPGVGGPPSVYPPPPYGAPGPVYAAPPSAYYGAPATIYAAPPPAYVMRGRILGPTEVYAAELPPRPPAPIPYNLRPRW
jgi:hypothetical protein